MNRQPSLFSENPRVQLVVDDETDAAGNDEGRHRQVYDRVALVSEQAVAEQGVTAVVEGRDGEIDGVEERLVRREILRQAEPEQEGARGLVQEG